MVPQQPTFQPIFVQQLTLKQLQQMQHLNFLKESVPCIDYLFGFCMDGDKDCIYLHPKQQTFDGDLPTPSQMPSYKPNECLPQEYIEKVEKYFDDSQISNVNMIEHLMK